MYNIVPSQILSFRKDHQLEQLKAHPFIYHIFHFFQILYFKWEGLFDMSTYSTNAALFKKFLL